MRDTELPAMGLLLNASNYQIIVGTVDARTCVATPLGSFDIDRIRLAQAIGNPAATLWEERKRQVKKSRPCLLVSLHSCAQRYDRKNRILARDVRWPPFRGSTRLVTVAFEPFRWALVRRISSALAPALQNRFVGARGCNSSCKDMLEAKAGHSVSTPRRFWQQPHGAAYKGHLNRGGRGSLIQQPVSDEESHCNKFVH